MSFTESAVSGRLWRQMTDKIKEQILAIRDSRRTNMFDTSTFQRIAYESEY